jgi:hypothetical protein
MTEEAVGSQAIDGTIDELKEQVEELISNNSSREEMLAAKFNASVNPLNFFHARLSALVSVLLDEEHQLKLEIVTQTMVSNILDMALNTAQAQVEEAETQQRRQTLLEGISPSRIPQEALRGII